MMLRNVWRDTQQRALLIGLSFLCIGILTEYLFILFLNSGHFVYTLDDPYIHLALAENIAKGYYGINSHEFSSPSSSILWPFLLAPFAKTHVGEYTPFLINIFSAFLTVWLCWKILCKVFTSTDRGKKTKTALIIAVGLISLILGTNMIALIFTGMEHSLQVLLAVVIVWGLIVFTESKRVPPWLMLAIFIAPLIRYENLAVSLAALLCLFWQRHYKLSLLLILAIVLSIGSFSIFLVTSGLEPFPASVLVKSSVVANSGHVNVLLNNFYRSITQLKGFFLFFEMLLLLAFALVAKGKRKKRIFAVSISLAIVLHLCVGGYGWYNRYEIYIWMVAILTLLYVGRDFAVMIRNPRMIKIAQRVFVMLFVVASFSYLSSLMTTPVASNNVYEQQYQMHRLALAYNKPIAVNDIGYVSYRNDNYILDLWGLASLKALHHRRNNDNPEWMNELAILNNVQFAMLYESWLPELSENWKKVGELHLGKKNISLGHNVVAFYMLNEASYQKMYTFLKDFRETLPEGTKLRLTPGEGDK